MAVTDGRAELGIIADTVDSGRLECTMLRPDRLVVIVPANHPLADRDQVAFSACLDYPFLGFTQGNPLQEHLSGQSQPLGLRPRYRAHLPTAEAICAAVAAPRDAPAQQLLLISAAATEQPAIIDLNADPGTHNAFGYALCTPVACASCKGEAFLPGVVATDLDTEHGGTDAN